MKIDNKKKKKGFTLIELIVVIAILAILAAIAVPNFIGMTNKANTATEVAAAAELANAINIHNTMVPPATTALLYNAATGTLTWAEITGATGINDATLTPTVETSIQDKAAARVQVVNGVASVGLKT